MKKSILFAILLLLLSGNAFAQQIVEARDLQTITDDKRGTVYYLKGKKHPLKGEYRILSGLDEEMIHFSRGVKDGEYKRYRYGTLREKGAYVDGKRHGLFVEYQQDGKTPLREAPMQHGRIEGTVRTYFANGEPDTEKEYKQSKLNGMVRRYDPETGKQIYEAHYVDDQKEGREWEISNITPDGWCYRDCSYKDGVLHGDYSFSHTLNGELRAVKYGEYKDGKKVGVWREAHGDGIIVTIEYVDGREISRKEERKTDAE